MTFQKRASDWLRACFSDTIATDQLERGDRLLEEVFELLQSKAYPVERIETIKKYVYSRPVGEPAQEVGGVMVTLAAFCYTANVDMHEAGEVELARISEPEIMAKIRAKQASKPKGSPLPASRDRISSGKEYQEKLSELAQVERILLRIPPYDVAGKHSFEARWKSIYKAIREWENT